MDKENTEKLVERLKLYPDKNIELIPFRLNFKLISTDPTHAFIRTLLSQHSVEPDIFTVDNIYLADFNHSGFLADLSPYLSKDELKEYLEDTIGPAIIDNKVLGIPVQMNIGLIYYRKDLLQESGLEEPKTWNDLKKAITTIKKKHSEIEGFVGQYKEYEGLVCSFLEMAWSNDADPFKITQENKSRLVETLNTLVNWIYVDKIIPTSSLRMAEKDSFDMFTNNKAIFVRSWSGSRHQWFKNKTFFEKVGVMPWPIGPSGKKSYMVTGNWYYAINSFSPNINKATQIIKFLNNPETQRINFLGRRIIPSRKEIYFDKNIQKEFPQFFNLLDQHKFIAKDRPSTPFYSEYSRIISSSIHKALLKNLTVEEAIDRIEKEIKNINTLYKDKL